MPSIHILHVEDDALDQLLLKRWIARAEPGVDVVTAGSEAELVAALSTYAFVLVVTDNRLPAMNAAAVVRVVRGTQPAVPVAVVSGGMTDEQRRAALDAGAVACLDKQDRDGILRVVRHHCRPEAAGPSESASGRGTPFA